MGRHYHKQWQPTGGTEQQLYATLSPREKELVGHIVKGVDSYTIASRMEIKYQTVKNMLYEIYDKLAVNSRSDLTVRYHAIIEAEDLQKSGDRGIGPH